MNQHRRETVVETRESINQGGHVVNGQRPNSVIFDSFKEDDGSRYREFVFMPKLNIYKLKDLPYISIDVEDKKTLYTAIMYNQLTLSRLSHENGDLIFSFLPAVFGRELLQSRECVV